ncbi:Nose resistant to fluoxetine protein 6 [Aphelenchoides bicaudatus]|nr:Nose resistant to fluoxetine protein 6 [Aphelenchoides bicaudatus]
MKPKEWFTTVLTFTLICQLDGCILCPYRIPPKPKPLDQMQIPSAEKIIEMLNGLVNLCENKTSLTSVSEACRNDVTSLVCSFNDLRKSYQNKCPGPESPNKCATCQRANAKRYAETSWIQTWLDSIGKMPSGIKTRNYHWLGDYEQCEDLKTSNSFNGRYCLVDFAIPSSVSQINCNHTQALEVSLGACLPASCSTDESTSLVQQVTKHPVQIRCEARGQWSITATIVGVLILAWFALLWIMTFIHWWVDMQSFPPFVVNLVLALSLQRNAKDSMRTKRDDAPNFHAAQGINVLCLFLLASGYVFYLMMPYLENPIFAYEFTDHIFYQPLANFSFYVDGLLALGALRLALKLPDKFATFGDLLKQLFRRFARTWPAYAIITLFMASTYDRLGEGPMWSHNDMTKRCSTNWWANILFINNFFDGSMICLDTGFLIVLEAQLFIFGSILLFLLNRYRKAVLYTSLGLCLTSIVYTFIVVYRENMYATLIPTKNVLDLRTYGFYLFHITITIFCWFLVTLIVWGPYYLKTDSSQVWQATYAALHRFTWAFIILFGVYSLDNSGQKNLRNSILSYRVFHPMGKLTYLVFLICEPVCVSLFASLHRPIYLTAGSAVLTCVGCVIFSYIVAFLIDITISRPTRNLLDLCLNRLYVTAEQESHQE